MVSSVAKGVRGFIWSMETGDAFFAISKMMAGRWHAVIGLPMAKRWLSHGSAVCHFAHSVQL